MKTKDVRFHMLMSKEEKGMLTRVATAWGMSDGGAIRRMLEAAASQVLHGRPRCADNGRCMCVERHERAKAKGAA